MQANEALRIAIHELGLNMNQAERHLGPNATLVVNLGTALIVLRGLLARVESPRGGVTPVSKPLSFDPDDYPITFDREQPS